MEPSCYKAETERQTKVWMEVSSGKLTAHLPKDDILPVSRKHSQLQRSTSEILVSSSSYGGYKIERTRYKYIIRDIISPESSAGSLAPRNLFQQDVEGVESKDGVIPLTRARPLNTSRSCINIHISGVDHVHPPECSNREFPPHPDVRPSRILNIEGLQLYNQALLIFKNFLEALNLRSDFQEVEQQFIVSYPNYWKHLLKKCNVYMNPEMVTDEQEAMTDVVGICTRTLQDEMAIERRSSVQDIGLNGIDDTRDFKTSIRYLKTKYPYLFAYMARKHDFIQFTRERTKINRNWCELENLLKMDPAKLAEREKKYSRK